MRTDAAEPIPAAGGPQARLRMDAADRAAMPDAAFALTTSAGRMFPHHTALATDGLANDTVDMDLLMEAMAKVPGSALPAAGKMRAWMHLRGHALALGMPVGTAMPTFRDGPAPAALMMRSRPGDADWGAVLLRKVGDEDRAALQAAMASASSEHGAECGRPTSLIQVCGTGRRFLNGSWVTINPSGESSFKDKVLSLSQLAAEFAKDKALGEDHFVDFEHAHSNREGDFVSGLSGGDVLALEVRPAGLWAKVMWTARAAAALIGGEYNKTSIHFRWFGTQALSDPPEERGPFLVNFALTNNPAWKGLERASLDLSDSWDGDGSAVAATDGRACGAGPHGGALRSQAVRLNLSLMPGQTVEMMVDSIRSKVRESACMGMFGNMDGSWGPCVHVEQIGRSMAGAYELVVRNCDEDPPFFLVDFSMDDDGKGGCAVTLTNPRRARNTYVEIEDPSTSMVDRTPDPGADMITDRATSPTPAPADDVIARLRDEFRAEFHGEFETYKAGRDAEAVSLRDENRRMAERLAALEQGSVTAVRTAFRSEAKSKGVTEVLMEDVLRVFDAEGRDKALARVAALRDAGLFKEPGSRQGRAATEGEAGSGGSAQDGGRFADGGRDADRARTAAWRKIGEIRAAAEAAGSRVTHREAIAKLREEDASLYRALGTFEAPKGSSASEEDEDEDQDEAAGA